MELEQEKFNSVAELAEIQTQISAGRGTLSQLKEDTETYLKEREEQAVERVKKVLNESREVLENATKNHDELITYRNELRSFADSLRGFAKDIVALIQGLKDGTAEVNEKIDNHLNLLADAKRVIDAERERLARERSEITVERKQIDDLWRELRDRQAEFIKGKKEITGKKVNI